MPSKAQQNLLLLSLVGAAGVAAVAMRKKSSTGRGRFSGAYKDASWSVDELANGLWTAQTTIGPATTLVGDSYPSSEDAEAAAKDYIDTIVPG